MGGVVGEPVEVIAAVMDPVAGVGMVPNRCPAPAPVLARVM